MIFDTIASISTPYGEGGISIIRISGEKALDIIKKIFRHKSKKVEELKNFSMNYGKIVDENENIIDEVLVSIMKKPNSYTREDVVEINCHGGLVVTRKVLEQVLKNGARQATRGEFTKRAFINGRIDLTQAESILELIESKTDIAASISLNHLRGDIRNKIELLKNDIIDLISHVNVVLDYPEEGIEEPFPEELYKKLENIKKDIEETIITYDKGKRIRDGIRTSIIGKPNVGKSSLLNLFLREERAIVTEIAGTTRDIIEENINIKGIPLILVDTAGIRDTENLIERLGIEKTKKNIESSELILFVLDGSEKAEEEDKAIYEIIKDKNVIGIINKIDIDNKICKEDFKNISLWFEISVKKNIGFHEMEEGIYKHITDSSYEYNPDKLIITNMRHKIALDNVLKCINNTIESINKNMPLDFLYIDLKEALNYLSEITGEITSEDILDNIFKNFCVGK